MGGPETAASARATPKTSRGRSWAARAMLFVFCLSSVLSILAVWTRNQINDTDRYVRTVAPLASDPAIQTALAGRVTTWVNDALDGLLASDGLADRERLLAAPLTRMVEQYVEETVQTVVTSDRFPELWDQINRLAHPVVSGVLLGEGTPS